MKHKAKIAMNAQEAQEINNSIKENRDIMKRHLHDLKTQMKIMQDNMRKKLTKLTVETDVTLKTLQEKDEKVRKKPLFYMSSSPLATWPVFGLFLGSTGFEIRRNVP